MVKLSQQIDQEIDGDRITRTERVEQQQKIKNDQRGFATARAKIQNATYENYDQVYASIDPKYREGILSPAELKQSQGYSDYQDAKKKQEQYDYWKQAISDYEAYKKSRPFPLGLSPSQERLRKFQEVKRGIEGKQSEVPAFLIKATKEGLPKTYSSSPKVYGVDKGEKVTITTKDKGGEITRYEEYQKVPVVTNGKTKYVLQYGSITGEEIKALQEQYVKQQQDQAFWEYKQSKIGNEKYDVPVKILTDKDLPYGYGGQQTISDQPFTYAIDEKTYYDQQDKPLFTFGLSDVWGGVKKGFNWVDERVHYTGDITKPILFGKVYEYKGSAVGDDLKLDYYGTGGKTQPEKAVVLATNYLSKKANEIEEGAIGKEKIDEFSLGLEEKYETQYQTAFENKYMKDLIYNETTFEEASKEFEESDEAKLIQRRYREEYAEGFKELQQSPNLLTKWGAGAKRTGLSLAQLGLKAVETPSKTALTSGGAYAGIKSLSLIPSVVSYSATGGLFVYGSYKALSPTSTIDEAGSGLITAIISGATLGYGAYKWWRSPVVKTKSINPKTTSAKASEVIGKDVKIITKDGSTVNKVVFENQKLSQYATAGRRTIVSTKGRVLMNKFWRAVGTPDKYTTFESNAIYKGIPTQQLGRVYKVTSLRGTTVIREPSAYQKALKLLKEYGYSDYQAKSTLRYIAPRITEQYLSKGILTVKGSQAIGEFEYLTKQPVVTIDKNLGIKTRGARTIKDVYDVQRKLINLDGSKVVVEQQTRLGFILDKKSRIVDLKDFDYSKTLSVGKTSDLIKGYEPLKVGKVTILQQGEYKDLFRATIKQQVFPQTDYIDVDFSRTKLFNKIIDLQDKGIIKPANIKKTPFSKTFSSDQATEEIIKKITKTTPSKDLNKVINKIDDIRSTPIRSEYWGTGQYERSFGGLSPRELQQAQQQLKVAVNPRAVYQPDLKSLIQFKQFNAVNLDVGIASAGITSLNVKQDLQLKSLLKTSDLVKTNYKNEIDVKSIVDQKTSPQLKSQLKSLLDLETQPINDITQPSRSYRPPRIPDVTPPKPKPFVFFLPSAKGGGINAGLKKAIFEKAYLPDFTSRALGLTPETITQKQAQKKLKKLLTGLEIRRGVVIK